MVGKSAEALISIIIPAFNEEKSIESTIRKIYQVLSTIHQDVEIIVVDDGSLDRTFEIISDLHKEFQNLKVLQFSRNFGKEAAILAGLKAARGEAVITIDADLQHPPTLIPQMIEMWRNGSKVVHAVKRNRDNDNIFIRWRAAAYNNLLVWLGGVDLRNSSDFKLLDRIAVNVIVKELREHKRFYRGLARWLGFQQESVFFDIASRDSGESKWSIRSLIGLAITGIISFSGMPLRVVSVMGFLTLILAFFVTADTLWSWFRGTAVSGFATIVITLLLIGSFIMISLGILGEYVAKIYEEIKGRPNYLINKTIGFED